MMAARMKSPSKTPTENLWLPISFARVPRKADAEEGAAGQDDPKKPKA